MCDGFERNGGQSLPGSTVSSTNIAYRLDTLPITRHHLAVFVVLGLGLLFDQMEGSMTGVLAAVFTEPGSAVSRDSLSSMITLYYVVAAIGAPLMGFVALMRCAVCSSASAPSTLV